MQHATEENPYAAPEALLAEILEPGLPLAGRGQRLAATILDAVFLVLAIFIGALPAMLAGGSSAAGEWSIILMLLALTALLVVNAVLVGRRGQTLAKYLLKIRVVRRDGSEAGFTRIFFARYLPVTVLGALPWIGVFVGLTDALMIFRDNRRCLHDEIADTVVVNA
jgi:uncharacterized RDD family membrane protein YckC